MSFGDSLGVIYTLTLTNEKEQVIFQSDGTELCRDTAIVFNQLFIGEVYDARIASSKSYQQSVVTVTSFPEIIFSPEDSIPDRIIRRVTPTLLFNDSNRKIYDVGENISGFAAISTQTASGNEIHIRFAENISGSELNFDSTGSQCLTLDGGPQIMEDVFIGDGTFHIYEPSFVWHSFRYFEITGDAAAESVAVVHSDTPVLSSFSSDSKELNWLYTSYLRTQLDNMHSGVPSDCPHRERLGYTGDGQICAPTAMMMLDCQHFYRKWIRDIFDSQDTHSGHINHTAPFAGGGGGPGGWGCAAILVPYSYYRQYGDIAPLREHYDGMRKWIYYLLTRSENGLIMREEEGGWCLGDWCTLEKTAIPEPFVNTCYFVKSLEYLENIAAILGHDEDIPFIQTIRSNAKKAIEDTYYNKETGSFANSVQGADAYALYIGLGDNRTFSNLIEKYSKLGHFDTGFLCTDILLEVLFERNASDLAFTLLSAHEPGSFGYMMDHGATTIWECWNGMGSHNHPMFGACSRQLLNSILGIRQTEDSVAYHDIIIKPCTPNGLRFTNGSLQIPSGKISVSWEAFDDAVFFDITLPDTVSCRFQYGGTVKTLFGGQNQFHLSKR